MGRFRQTFLSTCAAVLLMTASAYAGFDEGQKAYDKGDYAEAFEQWLPLAQNGDAKAQGQVGRLYARGQGVGRSDDKAVGWWRKAAEQNDSYGQNGLGIGYRDSIGGLSKDDAQAVSWFRKAAEQGNALGQANLGLMYANGRGVPKDDAQAVSWFRKAAEQGNALGQVSLGAMYVAGRGLPKDDVQAMFWFRKAADQGDARAQAVLGLGYMNGEGVAKDDRQAVSWLRKAADQGDADGQVNLGNMYANGRGVPKDDAQAVFWYRKAADQGDARGQVKLGGMYQKGQGGLQQDYKQAVVWFRKSAEQNDEWGQVMLGAMYLDGTGVPKDVTLGKSWLQKAAAQGNELAKETLAKLNGGGRPTAQGADTGQLHLLYMSLMIAKKCQADYGNFSADDIRYYENAARQITKDVKEKNNLSQQALDNAWNGASGQFNMARGIVDRAMCRQTKQDITGLLMMMGFQPQGGGQKNPFQ